MLVFRQFRGVFMLFVFNVVQVEIRRNCKETGAENLQRAKRAEPQRCSRDFSHCSESFLHCSADIWGKIGRNPYFLAVARISSAVA